MYENIAWSNFVKTGSIESFLEYRKLMDLENIDSLQSEGVDEFIKSERNSNKRKPI